MKKINVLGFSVIMIILIIGGVMSACNHESIKNKVVTYREPIKIGATFALSGKYAIFGNNELRGFKIALDEINDEGGINNRRVILVAEDNKGDAKEAVNSVHKILAVDDPAVIVSAFTHITNAVKDLVINKPAVLLYISTYRPIAESSRFAFRDYFDAGDNGRAIVKLLKHYNKTRAYYIGENSDQCETYRINFEKEAKKQGISIVKEEVYNIETTDLKTVLLKLGLDNSRDSDGLVTCTWRHENILMRQLKELGLINKVQSFHWVAPYLPSAQSEEITELFIENNAVSTWYGFKDENNPRLKEFIKKYKEEYGEDPMPDAAYAYDDAKILVQAIKNCDDKNLSDDADCISKELLATDYDGLNGKLSFDKNGISQRPIIFIKAENNGWTSLTV